jgi:hypothetical protein
MENSVMLGIYVLPTDSNQRALETLNASFADSWLLG